MIKRKREIVWIDLLPHQGGGPHLPEVLHFHVNRPLQYFSSSGLSAENCPHVSERWKANLVALSRSVVGQTFMVNQLVDMEWKFGVTAGSSDLKVVGQTFLQLKMVVDRGGTQEDVFMELTLPQFYSFLHEMEKAKSTLEYFS